MKEPLVQNNNDCLKAVVDCTFKKFQDLEDLKISVGDQVSSFSQNTATQLADLAADSNLSATRQDSLSKILVVGGANTNSVCEIYNSFGAPKQLYPDLPNNLSRHCVLKFHNFVYCMGGSVDNNPKNPVKMVNSMNLDERTRNWNEVASMKEKRCEFGAAIFDGCLVVSGGCIGDTKLDSVEAFQICKQTWKQISSMKHSRCRHALVATDKALFAIGGRDDTNSISSSVEQLDDLQGSWNGAQPMNTQRTNFAAVNCRGLIYAIGGEKSFFASLNSVEMYDPSIKQWSFVKRMSVKRDCHAACVLEEKIFVVGGLKSLRTIECYDPEEDQWSLVDKLDDDYHDHALVAI